MNIEQVIADCVQSMQREENAIEVIDAAIAHYPGYAALFFLRASEQAENGEFQLALNDFATALVLEPEFHLARLQYIFCSISLQQTLALPVLLQPLLQLDDCAIKFYANAVVAILQGSAEQRDSMLSVAEQFEDAVAPVAENIRQLMVNPPEVSVITQDNQEQNGVISSILLEVYQRRH